MLGTLLPMLDTLLPTTDKTREQGVATFFQRSSVQLYYHCRGSVLKHYMSRGTTVNRKACGDLLENHLKSSGKSKRPDLCCYSVQFHATTPKKKKNANLRLESLPHPIYSSDRAQCDYHVFETLKEALGGKKFIMEEEI